MAYTIIKSDGTELVTITDGALDTTTSLDLPGPNYVGYGEKLNENLVFLLENFSSNSAPGGTSLEGQLWYDKFNQRLNVYTPTGYKAVNGTVNATLQPTQPSPGDIWFNTGTDQSYIYDNGQYKLIGPQYTKQVGISGAIPLTVNDGVTIGLTHNILALQIGGANIATVSYDTSFTPSPAIPGFSRINTGITFNSNILATINANVTGVVFGGLVGGVTGDVTGNLTGNVVGNVTGNVTGNLTGNVVGNVTGNLVSVTGSVTNLSSVNATISGGSVTGLTNLTSSLSTITQLNATTADVINISSGNAQLTGGNVTNIHTLSATTAHATNFSSGNVVITSGTALGLANIQSTLGFFGSISTGAISVTGGLLTGLTNLSATTAQATNFSSSNVVVTGGNLTGVTLSGVTQAVNIVTSNAQVTGGNVSGVTGVNNTFTNANLINSVTTTKTYSDSTTAIATTAFVQSVMPRGIIIMWNNTSASIPTGFQLCDGSNGTPDLRDRFIVGAGNSYAFGANGGANSNTLSLSNLPTHTHSATSSFTGSAMGGHSHSASDSGHTHTTPGQIGSFFYYSGGGGNSGVGVPVQAAGTTGTGHASITVSSSSAGTPSGNVSTTVANTGSIIPASIDNRPLYFALCYIQKMF